MIKTLVVEDNMYIQKHFCDLITNTDGFELVDATRDAFIAEQLCNSSIDLILMDVQTAHNHSGLAAGRRIKERFPNIKIVIITSLIDPQVMAQAKQGACDSMWYKDHGNSEIMDVISKTLDGQRVFPDELPSVELEQIESSDITPRQLELLRCYIKGMTYVEIGRKFNIGADGVRWNINDMVRKSGYANREQLVTAVIENKLIVTTLKD